MTLFNKNNASLILAKIGKRFLKLIFRFEHWHTSVFSDRPYAVDIVNYCNQRSLRSRVIEIGCGLGDIIRRLNYDHKTGLDIDSKVIRAAKFLNAFKPFENIHFHTFQFPKAELPGPADVIIMVNWPFFFDSKVLKENITKYFFNNLNEGGSIIIDTLQDPFYPNNHNIETLIIGLHAKVIKIGSYDRQREVWAIEKHLSVNISNNNPCVA